MLALPDCSSRDTGRVHPVVCACVLEPVTLAVMHGSSFNGDCAGLLRRLADVFEERLQQAVVPAQSVDALAVG